MTYAAVLEVSGRLVGPTVFNTDERRFAALAGSIPVHLRCSGRRTCVWHHEHVIAATRAAQRHVAPVLRSQQLPPAIFVAHTVDEYLAGFPQWATRHFGTTSGRFYIASHGGLIAAVAAPAGPDCHGRS